MDYWQVRKYPPIKKGEEKKSKIPTWTSIIDIGQYYEGKEFTAEDYLFTEDKYVEAVKIYTSSIQVHELEIYLINKLKEELFLGHTLKYPECYSTEIISLYYSLVDGAILSGNQIENIVRLGMREDITCQLRCGNEFFLNFTYDYYMDIGSSIICEDAINQIKETGLYIDLWEWPYQDNVWDQSPN